MTTNDGTILRYTDEGSGHPLVILPGWSQTASMFAAQVSMLRDRYRVVVPDHRGHGESNKPTFGHRISRLAKDVDDLLTQLDLEQAHVLGWSMGCTVLWCYYDLFGPGRLGKIVLVDQPPIFCKRPDMSEQEAADTGAFMDFGSAVDAYRRVVESQEVFTADFQRAFLTERFDDLEWMNSEVLKSPADSSAALLLDLVLGDWRDVIPRIAIPTLVVGAGRSHIPVASARWIADQIAGAQLAIFEDRAHMLFFEEPDSFNTLVAEFLG